MENNKNLDVLDVLLDKGVQLKTLGKTAYVGTFIVDIFSKSWNLLMALIALFLIDGLTSSVVSDGMVDILTEGENSLWLQKLLVADVSVYIIILGAVFMLAMYHMTLFIVRMMFIFIDRPMSAVIDNTLTITKQGVMLDGEYIELKGFKKQSYGFTVATKNKYSIVPLTVKDSRLFDDLLYRLYMYEKAGLIKPADK